MQMISKRILLSLVTATVVCLSSFASSRAEAGTFVRFITNQGTIVMQLFDDVMPRSVDNFLAYVNNGRYDSTFVHRSAHPSDSGVGVIQGGGFYFTDAEGVTSITTFPAIDDEPGNGIAGPSNVRGTISFAKGGPNSVTSQWFINVLSNTNLDDPNDPSTGGFAAFGVILNNGMSVADDIYNLPRVNAGSQVFSTIPVVNFNGGNLTEQNLVYLDRASVINPKFGDVNFNGQVNEADLAIIEGNFGLTSGAYWDDGDLDMDGDVDGDDILSWQQAASAASLPAVNSVPEPASVALAACGIAALGLARRRQKLQG